MSHMIAILVGALLFAVGCAGPGMDSQAPLENAGRIAGRYTTTRGMFLKEREFRPDGSYSEQIMGQTAPPRSGTWTLTGDRLQWNANGEEFEAVVLGVDDDRLDLEFIKPALNHETTPMVTL